MIDRSTFYLEPIPVQYTLYYVAARANMFHISNISIQIDVFMNIVIDALCWILTFFLLDICTDIIRHVETFVMNTYHPVSSGNNLFILLHF